jgi:hypothetical protein
MSFHVISCHFMSFQVSLDFSDQLLIKSGGAGRGRGVKYVFLSLRRQLRCQDGGQKENESWGLIVEISQNVRFVMAKYDVPYLLHGFQLPCHQ